MASSVANSDGNRLVTVDAGASSIDTGSNVLSLTNSATCGFQKRAVAYRLPRTVLGGRNDDAASILRRSSSFFVQCRVYIDLLGFGELSGYLPQAE